MRSWTWEKMLNIKLHTPQIPQTLKAFVTSLIKAHQTPTTPSSRPKRLSSAARHSRTRVLRPSGPFERPDRFAPVAAFGLPRGARGVEDQRVRRGHLGRFLRPSDSAGWGRRTKLKVSGQHVAEQPVSMVSVLGIIRPFGASLESVNWCDSVIWS